MLRLSLGNGNAFSILCLGAHSDDIEIGCGGTVLRLLQEHSESMLNWVVFSAVGTRGQEAQNAAQLFAGKNIHRGPRLKTFQDGFMPFEGAEVKTIFEKLKEEISPDLIFTHNRKDAHQDHRLIAELTWNTFRDHLVLEYEVPKYDGDLGQPSVYVPLKSEICDKKVSYIMQSFSSQHIKQWFRKDTFLSLMRLRGVECNAPDGYAEAFYCRKLIL